MYNWDRVYTLLVVIEKLAGHGPKFGHMISAATAELEAMEPKEEGTDGEE